MSPVNAVRFLAALAGFTPRYARQLLAFDQQRLADAIRENLSADVAEAQGSVVGKGGHVDAVVTVYLVDDFFDGAAKTVDRARESVQVGVLRGGELCEVRARRVQTVREGALEDLGPRVTHDSSPSVGFPERSSAPGLVVGASEPTEGDLSHVAVSSEQLAVRKEVAILVNRAKRLLARAWHAGSPSMTEDPDLARLLGGPLYSAESCLWRASAALNHLVGFADADVIASDLGVDE